MNKSERVSIMQRMLASRRPIAFHEFESRLGASRATLYRDLGFMHGLKLLSAQCRV